MKNKFLIIFFILTFSLMMCSKNKDVIMMEEFQSSILDKNTIVLDVRTEEEYYGPLGHIENAILIPIQELQSRLDELNQFKNETIYVVCRSGQRSNVGKDILNANNFRAVNVDGGMISWRPENSER
tara:strand:- start:413 stop:790 length:378 start_codon:yes stop_codon:yes gene_type:complete